MRLIAAGWALGDLWPLAARWAHRGAVLAGIVAIAVAVLLIGLARRRQWRRRSQNPPPGPVQRS